jgi:hypothetical protein
MHPSKETATDASQPPRLILPMPAAASFKALRHKAELWGGGWQGEGLGGRLVIPVLAGLRRGLVGYAVSASDTPQGTRLEFIEEESDLKVHGPTVIVLLIAAAAALTCLVVPFVPKLLPLLPPCVVLCLATWLFIVARMRNSGLEEFIVDLEDDAETDPEDAGELKD